MKPQMRSTGGCLGMGVLLLALVLLLPVAATVAAIDPANVVVSPELFWTSGCEAPTSPTAPKRATDCTGGETITIRGRRFGWSGAAVNLIVPRSASQPADVTVPCTAPQHSAMLATLMVFCVLPAQSDPVAGAALWGAVANAGGAVSAHVQLVTVAGEQAFLRHAVGLTGRSGGDDDTAQQRARLTDLARADFARELGIGGLKRQVQQLMRRALATRASKSYGALADELGMGHVRGVLLHGLPGTGKTLVARKIAEHLGAKHVTVVNGPSIVSKFVGESERNLRELFAPAEADWKRFGSQSPLHVVILDEIDAIMRQRRNSDDGSGAIAIYDGMTTQLLALLDGLHSVGNVLVFGLTNRRDALDPALLRPGRLEVELRLPLPTEQGRAEILGIHTERMRARGLIAADVSLASIAAETASFSGADIAGLVRAAFSYAVTRGLYASMDAADGSGDHFEALTMADFARALPEVRRAKAWAGESAQLALRRGLIALPSFGAALHAATALIAHDLEKMPPWSRVRVLLHGPPESGVTAAAASLCANAPTAFDATYVLRADTLIGMGRDAVVDAIRMMGDAAQEVDRSCIVLDGLDVLLDAFNGFASVSSAVRSLLRAGVAPLARPSSDDGAAAETVGARVAVIATANNLAAISPLGPAASLFDVESATPLLGISETRQVLEAYGGIAAPEAERIAEQLAADIPLKRLVRAIDLARGRLATVRSRSAEGTTYAAAAAEPLGCRAAGYEGNAGGANALDLPECTPMGAGVAAATLSRVVLNAAASLHIDVPIDRSRW